MSEYVADTHALIWHLTLDARLSDKARAVFVDADDRANVIWISSITLVEIIYLIEKTRFPEALRDQILELLDTQPENYRVLPLEVGVVRALRKLSREKVAEMPDRIIAASAMYLDVPLISKDSVFQNVEKLTVVW